MSFQVSHAEAGRPNRSAFLTPTIMNNSLKNKVLRLLTHYHTQEAVAQKLGVSQSSISLLLHDKMTPRQSTEMLIDMRIAEISRQEAVK